MNDRLTYVRRNVSRSGVPDCSCEVCAEADRPLARRCSWHHHGAKTKVHFVSARRNFSAMFHVDPVRVTTPRHSIRTGGAGNRRATARHGSSDRWTTREVRASPRGTPARGSPDDSSSWRDAERPYEDGIADEVRAACGRTADPRNANCSKICTLARRRPGAARRHNALIGRTTPSALQQRHEGALACIKLTPISRLALLPDGLRFGPANGERIDAGASSTASRQSVTRLKKLLG